MLNPLVTLLQLPAQEIPFSINKLFQVKNKKKYIKFALLGRLDAAYLLPCSFHLTA
jgi:hypothetical protein